MYAVKNSSRALLAALVPLAAMHAILIGMALLATQTTPPERALPSPDKVLTFFVGRLVLDGTFLFIGHLVLRQFRISSRLAYGLMGGAMVALSYVTAIQNGFWLFPLRHGTEITSGLLPAIAGTISAFLYSQFAGFAPAALRQDAESRSSRTFDGPVRVRTSIAAVTIAAIVPAVLTAVLCVSLESLFLPPRLIVADSIFAVAIPAQVFLMTLIATVVPSAVLILVVHHLARAFRRCRGLDYSVIGGLSGVLCIGLFAPFIPAAHIAYLVMPACAYGAVMGALYRRFAGLEPLPLPEIVLANDEHALVGADHPSRRQHGVMLIGSSHSRGSV
ncbi:hypothetical protein [Bradyrhizobium sp. B120]|uniref:hypothetical protein n=1 Tax=Bradyrhizobium sp. B120 TaxID=3410088 RepID=UPI003B97FCD6